MSRNDVIGIACAVVAVAMIAWLSLDSWFIANCQDRMRAAGLDTESGPASGDPGLQACLERFGEGAGPAQ